jgi:hypothetical protein
LRILFASAARIKALAFNAPTPLGGAVGLDTGSARAILAFTGEPEGRFAKSGEILTTGWTTVRKYRTDFVLLLSCNQ